MGEVTILGGRPHRLLPHIVEEIGLHHQEGEICLLLVPEQYTLQAEVELIRRLDLPGFFNIQVLSPSRLTKRIFDAAGSDGRVPLDTRGKRMALFRAIHLKKTELSYYRRAAGQAGFVEKMSGIIADFKRGRLSVPELCAHMDALPMGALKQKLSDIASCWEAYEAQLAGKFVDGEDVQDEAARRLPQSGLFEGTMVYVYGFDLLAPQLCQTLLAGAPLCGGMTVALTMDKPGARDGALFTPVRQSAHRFVRMLNAQGIKNKWAYLPDTHLSAPKDIAHLEKNLFAYPARAFPEKPENIELLAAPTPYAEVHGAAARMIRLHEAGVPWGEMAVAAGDITAYGTILHAVFTSYGIPFYLEEKAPAAAHGLIRFLLHSLRAASKGYGQADILALVKSGYAPVTREEGNRLENYALSYGIYGDRWRKPFSRGDKEEAAALEPVRQAVIGPLVKLQTELKSAGEASQSLRAIFRLLERVNAYQTLKNEEERLLAMNMAAEAAKTRQVWQFLLGTLDQMHDLLAGSRAPSTLVAAWLEAGFSAGELSALPPTPDTVICGEIGHVMPGAVRVFFAMGLGDGLMQPNAPGLLRDEEREQLEALADTHLGLSGGGRDHLMRTDLLKTLTLPTEKLFLSHAQATQSGQSQRPAGFLALLKSRVFPLLVESGGVTGPTGPAEPLAPAPALDGLAVRLSALWDGVPLDQALDGPWLAAWDFLFENPQTRSQAMAIVRALDEKLDAKPLPSETAERLFGHQTMSVSRLEEYAQCPYKHFVRYGLAPVPRKEWSFDKADAGTLFHSALKEFADRALYDPAWPEVDRKACDGLMDGVLSPLQKTWADGFLGENAQNAALGKRYARIIRRAAWMFTQHMRGSRFRLNMAEVSFGMPDSLLPPVQLEMADGTQVLLRGVIDRVDTFEDDQSVYVRVVDYKSSDRDLIPAMLWWGLQLQLMLYLKAALNAKPGAEPAGAFYFHINDPLADLEAGLKEQAEEKIAQMLRLKGIVLGDVTVVNAMDPEGLSLKKTFKKDGELTSGASAVSLAKMHGLLDHAMETAAKLTEAMRGGRIEVSPARTGAFNACAYCDYAGVCRWDPRLPGAKPRVLPPLSLEELADRLPGEKDQE